MIAKSGELCNKDAPLRSAEYIEDSLPAASYHFTRWVKGKLSAH